MAIRWLVRIRSLIVALGGALAILALSSGSAATPVLAASALAPQTSAMTATTSQLLSAAISRSGTYTPAQLAAAEAYLAAHPFQGTIQNVYQASSTKMRTALSVGYYWWGVRIHLTNSDVVNLFTAIVEYGGAAVAAALCAPGVWAAAICGLLGLIVGWIIVTAVLQSTNNFGGCGINIDIPWSLRWHAYCA